ncbi:D-alanine--D-alanine ligase family protein [Peptoniphilus raoultii]|uniref:D-alanine--D-alanine ligase family protein n=1 Tax=Peptoniphilus raoultii TaxID=1776387 RepID=UPI0008D94A1A|nr:D-alanine--D-alanine ligase family protein [Peptoniphilus raoultii]
MLNVGVFFGGRSCEHEVSVITGLQIIENMDKEKFNPIPIYLSKDGRYYCGDILKDFRTFKEGRYNEATEIFLIPQNGDRFLYAVKLVGGIFSKSHTENYIYARIDAIFPALHGTFGEDGAIQGLFELMDIPYAGCGVAAGAVGMDKVLMKEVFKANDIPMMDYIYFYRDELKNLQNILKKCEALGYPLIIKPANLGSSIGISKAKDTLELTKALELAATYDRKIIVEKCLEDFREINVAVLGKDNDLEVSACEEPITAEEILTYEDKYVGDSKTKMASQKNQKKKLPADLTEEIRNKICELGKKSFKALDGAGVARIDFLLKDKDVYVNEINTLPGSISFYLFEASGLSFKDLITKLIEIALKRYEEKQKNIYSYDSNLFNQTSYGAKLK